MISGGDMKRIGCITLMIVLLVTGVSFAGVQEKNDNELRGIWVATVHNLDYPSKQTQSSHVFKQEAIEILDYCQSVGFNAVFLQVRPTGDALYPSNLVPWSKYLTGEQGLAPYGGFDPLKFWVEEAHRRGIELHAWFNPFRLSKEKEQTFSSDNIVAHRADFTVRHQGNLYLNPGVPEVRRHIKDVVMEVVTRYDIDGVHFDDYFYPGKDFQDQATYQKYKKNNQTLHEWRVESINTFIRSLGKEIHAKKPSVQYGVSPFAIWANKQSNTLGSNTRGNESLYAHCADTRTWVKNEWVDYIMPQIYWNIGFEIADYQVIADWWNQVVEGTSVDLFIGHAAYKTMNKDPESQWHGPYELKRQLDYNKVLKNVKGSVFFRYQDFINKPELRQLFQHMDGAFDPLRVNRQLVIGRPYYNLTTTATKYFIGGGSNPDQPLYCNGKLVKDRTELGYFGLYQPLHMGTNVFRFTQGDQTVIRTIQRYTYSSVPMQRAEIIPASIWPQTKTSKTPGQQVTLHARAPIGSRVTAHIGGKTYELLPTNDGGKHSPIYATSFTKTIEMPRPTGQPRVVNYGRVKYVMQYGQTTDVAYSPVPVAVIMDRAPYVALVRRNEVDSYADNTRKHGSHYLLLKGMKDYIIAEDGDLVQLQSGIWVKRTNVDIEQKILGNDCIKGVTSVSDGKQSVIEFQWPNRRMAWANYSHGELCVTFPSASFGVDFEGANTMVEKVECKRENDGVTYRLSLTNPEEFAGYYLKNTSDGVALILRKKFVAGTGAQPLKGSVIMIDPGHGGNDIGGVTLLGPNYSENSLMIYYSFLLKERLTSLGATVIMTRVDDASVSLADRLRYSRLILPDLFLSMHADSMGETRDLTKISGCSTFYKEAFAKSFAVSLREDVVSSMGRKDRGTHHMNFYVVRGTWCPSVLIEAAFMSHPEDFTQLMNPHYVARYVDQIAHSVVTYFQ